MGTVVKFIIIMMVCLAMGIKIDGTWGKMFMCLSGMCLSIVFFELLIK